MQEVAGGSLSQRSSFLNPVEIASNLVAFEVTHSAPHGHDLKSSLFTKCNSRMCSRKKQFAGQICEVFGSFCKANFKPIT